MDRAASSVSASQRVAPDLRFDVSNLSFIGISRRFVTRFQSPVRMKGACHGHDSDHGGREDICTIAVGL